MYGTAATILPNNMDPESQNISMFEHTNDTLLRRAERKTISYIDSETRSPFGRKKYGNFKL